MLITLDMQGYVFRSFCNGGRTARGLRSPITCWQDGIGQTDAIEDPCTYRGGGGVQCPSTRRGA
jgi:hypothetical protein